MEYLIKIRDSTTPEILDSHFQHVWTFRKPVKFVIDVRECNTISLGRILSIKGVLDHHRPNSRKYIDYSTILVKSRWTERLLNIGLGIIRTERPVYVSMIRDGKN
jgi:hypothetical protein